MNTEKKIEENLIYKLSDLKYVYRSDINDRDTLEKNFRKKFEKLNKVNLADSEFNRLIEEIINPDVFVSSKRLRQINSFEREDGTPLNYTLVNIKDWCKNDFEVINQLRINTRNSHQRYDVILLINGIPIVQIELKSLGVTPRNAIQQIVDYKNDPGNGYSNTLLCFMQLFIASNQTITFYFANNNNQHFTFNAEEQFLPVYHFADENNKKIVHIDDFTDKFLPKCILAEMINKYMVLVESEQKLLVMRPYQIYAVKAIVDCINQNRGNGYIWHTTGSGKTLTSFKASTLLKENEEIEKCLFVVDRKDLDKQTRDEFNKFQPGCVEENTNTFALVKRLMSNDYADKVIVTTIQKLGLALDENSRKNNKNNGNFDKTFKEQLTPLRNKRIVIIFDECHRSQFGENHKAIKEFFPNAQLFGFTGTPIFEKNSSFVKIDGTVGSFVTTKDIFQKLLHSYTITHAIEDKNVLSFHIDYFKPDKKQKNKPEEEITQRAVVDAIVSKHDSATNLRRFNAILATSSINNAIEYYQLFKEIQNKKITEDENFKQLNVACVFSPPAEGNRDVQQLQEDLQQEKADNESEPDKKKNALIEIIDDYNKAYKTNHSINNFDLYYQDIQKRIKDHKYSNADYPHNNKIDLVIVVDMLLTGFDSKFLNTLYVDKNLKYHSLIQAFSRTNRTLNNTKPHGNILDFRKQQSEVDEAIALFSGENVSRAKEIWLVDPAPVAINNFEIAVKALNNFMKKQNLDCKPEEVFNLKGDIARAEFINHFKEVQRLNTQLNQYTDITEEQNKKIENLIPEEELKAFRVAYLETAKQLKHLQDKEDGKTPPEVQQLDFEYVLFASALVDYDYIMALIAKYSQREPAKQKMTRDQIVTLISSSANLIDERDDIVEYIDCLKFDKGMSEKEIKDGYLDFKEKKYNKQIEIIANKFGLTNETLQSFAKKITDRMIFDGEDLTDLFAPLDLSWKERRKTELAMMEEFIPLLKRLAQGREISGLKAYE